MFLVLLILLGLTFIFSIFIGGSGLTVKDVIDVIFGNSVDITAQVIIWKIRLPRIILSMLIGAGLAVSGGVFQGILRNPLAEPYTLGISGGAVFGVTLSLVLGLDKLLGGWILPVCSFLGALLAVGLVYVLAARRRFSVTTLILSGVVLSYLFSSLVLLILALVSAEKVQNTLIWLMGDLSTARTELIPLCGTIVVLSTIVLIYFSRELDLLTLGEERAVQLGVSAENAKKMFFILASFLTGTCVAMSGVIGFVGLIIPHLMRRVAGNKHLYLIPSTFIAGAIFLALCDTLARTIIVPLELPVGVITGVVGGVFFLWYLMKNQKKEWF